MAMTDSFEADIINHFLRNQAVTPAINVYIGLSTTTPAENGSNFTEPVGNGYARQIITLEADSAGTTHNSNIITFGPNTGSNWGTVVAIGIFFDSSGGNLKMWKPISGRTMTVGVSLEWAALDLTVIFD